MTIEKLLEGQAINIAHKISGRHASADSKIIVDKEGGGRELIRNLNTKITAENTTVEMLSAYEGHVNLRIEDKTHHDFWIEFTLSVDTLEKLLEAAKRS